METWVLIIALFSGFNNNDHPSVTTQEFSSKDRCIVAARLVLDNLKQNRTNAKTVCVKK